MQRWPRPRAFAIKEHFAEIGQRPRRLRVIAIQHAVNDFEALAIDRVQLVDSAECAEHDAELVEGWLHHVIVGAQLVLKLVQRISEQRLRVVILLLSDQGKRDALLHHRFAVAIAALLRGTHERCAKNHLHLNKVLS
jgi:hypothetical protein